MVIPAAVAWACNPQAHINLDRSTYAPGQTITVYGSYFPNGASITVSGPGGSKVVTAAGGSFVTTFTAPTSGNFTVTASRPTGGFASAAGTVAQPQPAQPAPQQQENPPASSPNNPSLDSPGVVRSEREPSTTGRRGGGGGGGNGQAAPGGGGGGSVQTVAGQPVFVGSAAPVATGTFATAPASDRGARAARGTRSATPSEQAAASDVWSGFAPGRTASLTSGEDGLADGGAGSGLGLGIGLLALALLGLAGGLAAAEVRRRRTA